MTTGTGIYHWKLGDIAMARLAQKVYCKVKVIKNEKGLFYADRALGISANEDDTINVTWQLCYFVETCRTKHKMWLPYTCMHLAERSRPFYGPLAPKPSPKRTSPTDKAVAPRKRKIKEDVTLPLSVKLTNLKDPDFNTTYDMRHVPLKQGKYENAFSEFVRRGKEMIFDEYFFAIKADPVNNKDVLEYLMNVDASTEDKVEMVIEKIATEKEIENYLHQCWRYNFVHKMDTTKDNSENNSTSPVKAPVTVHISWCLVCGKGDKLRDCPNCPSSFHLPCRREWLVNILHRKNPPQKPQKPTTVVHKILSSTRTICSVQKNKENMELCPSCMWGPKVGYDDVVWHKLGSCPWWPARVLTPGATPSCLLTRTHSPHQWPLKYYGE
ncbi:hypothetical protein O3G_MSEX013994 [Manduca sexta]|uniref:PWWP domain-containing protein n=2 Tax=Manduca sexta TaxID=7130 RepID=A0A921ZUW8_MANSE|nr:hypothetical protein O3G_MSEX013994 [Manduca sexta]